MTRIPVVGVRACLREYVPHPADLLLVNVGRVRLQFDPVIFQRAARVVQDERGAVVLLVLPTGIVDEEASATWYSVTLAASSAFFTSRAGRYPRAYPERCAAPSRAPRVR